VAYLFIVTAGGFSDEGRSVGLATDPAAADPLRRRVLNRLIYLPSPSFSRPLSFPAPGVLILSFRVLKAHQSSHGRLCATRSLWKRRQFQTVRQTPSEAVLGLSGHQWQYSFWQSYHYSPQVTTTVLGHANGVLGRILWNATCRTEPDSSDGHVLKLDATC
jgi:hypothetical protein